MKIKIEDNKVTVEFSVEPPSSRVENLCIRYSTCGFVPVPGTNMWLGLTVLESK